MKAYFSLQFKILNRKLNEIGFRPIVAYSLGLLAFYGFSLYMFSKTDLAEYFYALIALSFVSKLSEQHRNDFLKTTFSIVNYRKLRIIENLVIIFPFILFLIFKQSLLVSLSLILLSIFFSILNFNNHFNFTIPTPFSKKPFEFPVGFRKTFFIFPFAYFLTYQSISFENFNLGIFSILTITAVVLSYYSKSETEYYIWSFNLSPKGFLIRKIKTGILFFTFLTLPALLSLILYFPEELTILIISMCLSYAYIIAIILAKYSAYPNNVNSLEGLIIGLSLIFPPIIIVIIPYFYSKATKQLKPLLEND